MPLDEPNKCHHQDLRRCITKAMQRIIAHGETALHSLENDDWQTFTKSLDDRQKIFLNFKALEHLAITSSLHLRTDQELGPLFKEMCLAHQNLHTRVKQTSANMIEKFKKINRSAQITRHYGSGHQAECRLIKFT